MATQLMDAEVADRIGAELRERTPSGPQATAIGPGSGTPGPQPGAGHPKLR
jgi:hypothetical protein